MALFNGTFRLGNYQGNYLNERKMPYFKYFIPRNRKTTLTVSTESKQAVSLFALLTYRLLT
jgi:hypothetical protein